MYEPTRAAALSKLKEVEFGNGMGETVSGEGYTDYDAIIRVFDGTKLSNSSYSEAAVSSLLRDPLSNSLETHAPIFLKDPSEEGIKKVMDAIKDLPPGTKVILMAGAFVVVGGAIAVGKNWESIKSWGTSTLGKLRSRKAVVSKTSDIDAVEIDIQEVSTEIESVEISTEVEISEGTTVVSLTPEQWRQLFQSAVTLNSWEEQIWLLLSHAAIEGGDAKVLSWQRQMRELQPNEVAGIVQEILADAPDLADDKAIADLMQVVIRRLNETDERPKSIGE